MTVEPFAATPSRWLDLVLVAVYTALGLTPLLLVAKPSHHVALLLDYAARQCRQPVAFLRNLLAAGAARAGNAAKL